MHKFLIRLALLPAAAFLALASSAVAQTQSTADPEKPVTPPDSYRVVMENDRVRMIEIHIKARSKVNVDSPAGRERFLYMLSDGALVLAPPGKTRTSSRCMRARPRCFPAVSPTVENDTDSAVRALMVEIKTPTRERRRAARRQGQIRQGQVARARCGQIQRQAERLGQQVERLQRQAERPRGRNRKPSRRKAASRRRAPPASPMRRSICARPMRKPAKKVTGKSRGSDG